MKKVMLALALCALMSVAAFAADLNGSFVVKSPGRDGQTQESTYTFKVDGKKLTGSVTNPRGETQIKDGSVDGNNFEFSIERPGRDGATTTIKYKGKLDGDNITLSFEMRGNPVELKGERKK